jgi:hypothetical protein
MRTGSHDRFLYPFSSSAIHVQHAGVVTPVPGFGTLQARSHIYGQTLPVWFEVPKPPLDATNSVVLATSYIQLLNFEMCYAKFKV